MNQISGTYHSTVNSTSSTDPAAALVVKGGFSLAKDIRVGGTVAYSSIGTTAAASQLNASALELTATDNLFMIECVFSGNAIITLPTAASAPGKQYYIIKLSLAANTLTINTSGSDTIDGVETSITALVDPYNRIRLCSNGIATWYSG